MPFHVGDLVRIENANVLRPPIARVQQVLPQTLSAGFSGIRCRVRRFLF
jgi:hypothetical protein